MGADSVIDLDGEIISKPSDREGALKILRKLNGRKHQLISSVCISKNGNMIWNYTDKATLTMKNFSWKHLKHLKSPYLFTPTFHSSTFLASQGTGLP